MLRVVSKKIFSFALAMISFANTRVAFASGVTPPLDGHHIEHQSAGTHEERLMATGRFKYMTTSQPLAPQDALNAQWSDNSERRYIDPKNSSHYWFDFTMTNSDSKTDEMVLYHRSNFAAEELIFYAVNGGKVERIGFSGSDYPRDMRSLKTRLIGARIHVAPGASQRFLVSVRTSRNFYPDFGFTTFERFGHFIQESNFLMGICIGIHLIAILVSSFFAWALRDKGYAWFSALSFAMVLALITGFGFRDILLNKVVEFNSARLLSLLRPAVLFLFLQMSSTFLNLKVHAPRINQWMQATMISALTLAILSMQPNIGKYAIDGGDRLVFLGMILAAIGAYRCFRKNIHLSGYFLAATSTLIMSTLPLMITTVTTRNFAVWEMNLLPVGQSVEMMILSMALIAKVRKIDEARAGAETEAGKSEELKTLLRVMSHDLNNPLTVVISYARIGLKKAQSASLDDFSGIFGKILKASLNQAEIIEHIKLMRAVEDGKADLKLTSVSLLDALRQAESTFEQKLSEKKLTLKYNAADLALCSVLAESTSLNHNVLNNLLSNAIKFSHPGGTIEIATEDRGDQVRLAVRDHGVGMPPELVQKVFRTDAPTSRTGTSGETGTGFGMPVVKSYMNHFGGNISIESATEKESPSSHGTKVILEFKKAA